MAGTIGLWVNYATGKMFEVDEHERYIRRGNNAKKIGVPDFIQKNFKKFKPEEDRDKFLLYILDKSPLMRVREHDNYASFEFSSADVEPIFKVIKKVGEYLWLGEYSGLYIVNHYDNTSADILWKDFKKASQWADKVSDLSESAESFVSKKMFPTIFDYVKEAKVMTESQKKKFGILSHKNNKIVESVDLKTYLNNNVVLFDGENPVCYIEDFEKRNSNISKFAFDPSANREQKKACLKWLSVQSKNNGKQFINDDKVLERHPYYITTAFC